MYHDWSTRKLAAVCTDLRQALTLLVGSLVFSGAALAGIAEDNQLSLSAQTVMPGTGYPRDTDFAFSVTPTCVPACEGRFDVVLQLWSPTVENEWKWINIPADRQADGLYTANQKLLDYSPQYKYRFAFQDTATGEVVLTSGETAGPQLVINQDDHQIPSVSRTTPENMSTGVVTTQKIQWIFDEVIDPTSVSASTVTLLSPSNVNGGYTAVAYQDRLIVTFNEPFQQSTDLTLIGSKYTLALNGVRDLNGNAMSPYAFSFYIEPTLHQTYQIESDKYRGYCLAVKDIKKRFANPAAWNPVVELVACNSAAEAATQRWFLSARLDAGTPKRLHWAENFEFCLSKEGIRDPIIARCNTSDSKQLFDLNTDNGHYHIVAKSGSHCVASGVTDIGEINKVESSLCSHLYSRNRWSVAAKGLQPLSKPFFLGKFDLRHADITYKNALFGVNLGRAETIELVKYLYKTQALNQQQISDELRLTKGVNAGEGFITENAYYPRNENSSIPLPKIRTGMVDGVEVENPEDYDNTHEGYDYDDNGAIHYYQQEAVTTWWSNYTHGLGADKEVCAIKFVDAEKVQYNMKSFATREQALLEGWIVTHKGHCGVCSTLQDLAVYMGVKDQTTPQRLCSKRGRADMDNLDEVMQCVTDAVGFSRMCAESVAYNGLHTGTACRRTCMETYGNDALLPRANAFFTMVIAEKFDACPAKVPSTDPAMRAFLQSQGCPLENEQTGKLNACLWCDERVSGPGFKYGSARSRRNSGIESEIPRIHDKLYYEANHTLYFQ